MVQTVDHPAAPRGGDRPYRGWTGPALLAEWARLAERVVACDTERAALSSLSPRWDRLAAQADAARDQEHAVVAELRAVGAAYDVCDGCCYPTVPGAPQGHYLDCTVRPFTHPTGPRGPSLPDLDAAVVASQADIVAPFAGPGGACQGAAILGLEGHRIAGIDNDPYAVQVARAAGFPRVLAGVRDLDPGDWAHCRGAIVTPPCPTWTRAGRQSALQDMEVLREAIYCISGRCGCFWRDLPDRVSDPRTALAVEPLLWALTLPRLEWLVSELTPAAAGLWEEFAYELTTAEERQEWGAWAHAEVVTLDAVDYGAPARRRRVFLIARRYGPVRVRPEPPAGAFPVRSVAQALGWPPGRIVRTRGNRRTSGGNTFSADAPATCLTSRVRGWTLDGPDGARLPGYAFSAAEAGMLNGFPRDHPWDTPYPDARTGRDRAPSRTAMCQTIADVVSPMVAAAVLGAAMGVEWVDPVRAYLAEVYPVGDARP